MEMRSMYKSKSNFMCQVEACFRSIDLSVVLEIYILIAVHQLFTTSSPEKKIIF